MTNKRTAKIAVIGATGAVGREILLELQAHEFQHVDLYASENSTTQSLDFAGRKLPVQAFSLQRCKNYNYVLMSAGGKFTRRFGRQLAAQNDCLIDNSSALRMADDVPLVVPEVNAHLLRKQPKLIANPNCSTIQLVVVLGALANKFQLQQVQVATYQSVSGAGRRGVAEWQRQQQERQRADATPDLRVFAQQIDANILPAIDVFDEAGHCFEEVKMVQETQKILALPELAIQATCVRVPVLRGHGEAVAVKLDRETTRQEIQDYLAAAVGVELCRADDHALLPTPLHVAGKRKVYVARVRLPYRQQRSFWVQFFILADNLRKGAATNAVQIATEHLNMLNMP
ncbi:MAG: aspartate-semialdehyde dehydrogenase [Pseudomonadota bacterium]|nr:aspartate-semialdehyde dehydrogenase [Pseudomonadota bacterium]